MRVHRPIRAVLAGAVGGTHGSRPGRGAHSERDIHGVARTSAQVVTRSAQALSTHQRAVLHGIAKDTWAFYRKDVDPNTHLPLDNLGPGTYPRHLHVGGEHRRVPVGRRGRRRPAPDQPPHGGRPGAVDTSTEVRSMQRTHGFLYQWYDTGNGDVIRNPGDINCAQETTPGSGQLLLPVGRGQRLVRVRARGRAAGAAEGAPARVAACSAQMDFSIFYDDRAQKPGCNTNPDLTDDPPTGQMYGGYYVDQGPAGYHNGALYSDPRIAMYMGMGLHQMPGDVWWRTWRCSRPSSAPATRTSPGRASRPPQGHWTKIEDPQSAQDLQRLGGPLHLPRHPPEVHPDVRRRDVRGVDGQRGGAGDDVGSAQLRARGRPDRRGTDQVRDQGARLPRSACRDREASAPSQASAGSPSASACPRARRCGPSSGHPLEGPAECSTPERRR